MHALASSSIVRPSSAMTDTRGTLRLSADREEMDVDAIHAFLSEVAYWSRGIPRETVQRAVRNSVCVGVFDGDAQVAFARVVTDRATFAYLCDVYVLESHRKQGISKWMMQAVDAHPELQGLRRWTLITGDAHGLYAQFGWKPVARPERFMERTDPDIYARTAARGRRVMPAGACPSSPESAVQCPPSPRSP
jgi:GNAT superfamily N-acetyltransferase